MKRILVPTDLSPTAEKALRFAVDLAAKSTGTVVLYHVFKPVTNEFVGTIEARDLYNKQEEIKLLKRLQRLKKKVVREEESVPVSTVLGRWPVVDNILGFAEANSIDMIVMGTQGATGIRKTIVGTVASKIASQADIPVLLVPEKYDRDDPKHIVFATNYSNTDKHALAFLLGISKSYKGKVTVLHLRSAYASAPEQAKEKADFDAYAFALQRDFSQYKIRFQMLESSSVIETMENLYSKLPYDILAMVRRKKGFYEKFFVGSFTKNMAYVTTQPLLVIPEGMAAGSLPIEKELAVEQQAKAKPEIKIKKFVKGKQKQN